MRNQPATIKLFLVNGDPNSLRTAEISNWTGKAIACPRKELADLMNRGEINSPGIYILLGIDPESGEYAVYIGEAESLMKRIKGHSDKDFWNSIVVFFSKDENLTKAHVKYLEGKLIDQATKAKRAIIKNSQASGAKLPEADVADMDVYLDKILQLLPILGSKHFSESESKKATPKDLLYRKIKGLVAKGTRTTSGFIVFEGSQAVLNHRKAASPWIVNLRKKLIKEGILKEANDHLIFSTDCEFGSPSTAASVVSGGQTNGLTAWKDSTDKSIKQIENELTGES
jgi:hypothetical protein